MKRRSYPLPEAIDPGNWTIREDIRARVQLPDKQLFVPLSAADPTMRSIRAHELAHIAFSPKKVPNLKSVHPDIIQSVEDARVQIKAMKAGVSFEAGWPKRIVETDLQRRIVAGRAPVCLMLLSFADPVWQRDELIEQIRNSPEYRANPDRYDSAISLAITAYRKLKTSGPNKAAALSVRRMKQVSKWLAAKLAEPEPEVEQDDPSELSNELGEKKSFGARSLVAKWGTASIQSPRLIMPKNHRARRTADTGAIFSAPHRLHSDGRVFRAQLRAKRRGTVLIDASGSMSLTQNDIAAMAKAIPAGTIAAYSGRGSEGVIRILAKDGKIASDTACDFGDYGGNIIDGPALQWLSRQQEPRHWVCDGYVTVCDDQLVEEGTKEAERIRRQGKIVRLHDMETALETLVTKRRK